MTDRSQSVFIGYDLSQPLIVTHGIPQMSIFEPVLFNIYINDLPCVPKVCSLESYVDDSKLYFSFIVKDADVDTAQLTEDLRMVTSSCYVNSMLINPGKTKMGTPQMLKRVLSDFCVTLLEKTLSPMQSAGNLGITLDGTHQ